ncbi:polypeptide N-acetylgalactosaminyltransferase 15-like isoform X2 [Cheilinus undulatus]|uniref:polypeptide N-acetylgalactosaminyltransferase 15-like isoform X2 n=1 Tax=Cheilinus undulatus TaxID=241271 RepID=UPI001BD21E9A|nr:polypeptide N-acetylgalactosaminyltransferase 15-like isoform X2 [Cheilinus undulatus]
MRLWIRAAAVRRRVICLWLLLLCFALVTLALSDLFNKDQGHSLENPGPPRRPLQRIQSAPDLEIIVDSWDPALELGMDVAPLNSLQEDQLLYVASTHRTKNPPQRKVSYKVIIPGSNKDSTPPALPTHGATEKGVKQHPEATGLELSAVEKYGFNEVISESISLHRRLPEARHPQCLGEQYSESLPSASVIICFNDEAWSTLLRTVHSVLDTAPKQYLQEVLLVDDLSQHGHLKSVLSEYVSHLDGVRLIRSTKRLGVGGCRTLGAARAAGEVLVFMDSHCECQKGWLEPLLERVAQDRTRVVSPIMDVINWQTFQYNATQWPVRGVFDWRLDFSWESYPPLQDKEPDSAVQPVPSPALGGGVVAIDRHFFHSVGAYDPGMLLWGGEQIELSIRVWSCGGSMEVVPCSRVAHVDHHHLSYLLPDQEVLQRNKIRIADTWMDAYRKIFYRRDTLAHFIRQSESPNITERLRLKRSLGCRTFHWYLTTVYPQLYIPQDRPAVSGELYNVGTGSCADLPRRHRLLGGSMIVAPCSGTGNQHCDLNSDSEVRWGPMGALCLDAEGERVVASPCPKQRPSSSRLQWKFIKLSGQLVHQQSQLCVEAVKEGGVTQSTRAGTAGLFLRPCTHQPRQQWHFEQLVAPKGA